jgi:hypothetical protein
MKNFIVKIYYPTSVYEIEAKTKKTALKKAWERFDESYDCYPDEYEPKAKAREVRKK